MEKKIGVKKNITSNKAKLEEVKLEEIKEVKKESKKDESEIENTLYEAINYLRNGKRISPATLAAQYLLTIQDFREKCQENIHLQKLFEIYNGLYIENIMTDAIDSGKMNAQVEDYLKNELQSYTSSGFNQIINIIEPNNVKEYEVDSKQHKKVNIIDNIVKGDK